MKTDSCPTCGSICKVVGNVTMHYEPIGTSKVVKDILDAKYKEIVDKIDEMIAGYEKIRSDSEDKLTRVSFEGSVLALIELKTFIKEQR